ncbi:uncharacterized protein [Antedon mediterranea]|uniref:uncharacterized protein n=1 Tax=Antedon mediterranea TaxID=105859 RepID=UPI003AF5312E
MELIPVRHEVCILGHSFIRRLAEHVSNSPDDKHLRLNKTYLLDFKSKGGARVRNLPSLFKGRTSFDIVYIQIGEDDIGTCNISTFIRHYQAFTDFLLLGADVKLVIIGELIRRLPKNSVPTFNTTIMKVNNILESLFAEHPKVIFWRHRGFKADFTHVGGDGVHLSTADHVHKLSGMKRFIRSVRNALIYGTKLLRPV